MSRRPIYPSRSVRPVHAIAAQRGVVLVEVMASILIFSFAVLGLMGVQATAISEVSASKNRANAAYLADQIIGQMWSDQPNLAQYALNVSPAPSGTPTCKPTAVTSTYANVLSWLTQVNGALPNAAAANQQIYIGANNTVTVTVCWKLPSETNFHNFTETAQINV